jgi:uncharacterized repeat protein (TIGR01451 family)
MKAKRILSLGLTVFLQLAPVLKVAELGPLLQGASTIAAVMRWGAALAAVAGGFHTVTAASAAIVGLTKYEGTKPVGSPTNNAVVLVSDVFRYRITVSNAGSDHSKDYFNCLPLPPGLTIYTNLGGNGFITNLPNASLVAGVYPVRLVAGNTSYPQPVTYDATITILPVASPPVITESPRSLTVTVGQPALFAVIAEGAAPLSYAWFKDGHLLTSQTTASLSIAQAQPGDAGEYAVEVTNDSGTARSDPATLTVMPALEPPVLTLLVNQEGQITWTFAAEPGVAYRAESKTNLLSGSWDIVQEFPAESIPTVHQLTPTTTAIGLHVYRLVVVNP